MSERRWVDPITLRVSQAVMAACDGDLLLAAILLRRGLSDPDRIRAFLSPDAYQPAPPEALPDVAHASDLLQTAVQTGQRILVWGDFDVDGQTATALLLDGLRKAGADVEFYIPKRIEESHGIKPASLLRELNTRRPAVLLTCDTGIAEHDSIALAREQGVTVIVTDHHELIATLPPAHAVINPRRLPDDHPLSNLPGVGVAYKLLQHVYASVGRERDLSALLDLVALGIVGDVATQTLDTRYLLQRGLDQLRRTGRIGLQALLDVARVNVAKADAISIGYQLAPRLNAAGRLGDATISVELLTTRDRARAAIIARQLEGLNEARRVQTRQIGAAAEEMLKDTPGLLRQAAIVLYQPNWHAGLVGIVANSLAERHGKPVVLLSGADDGVARGSARAPGGYDIHAALSACSDMLRTFGGHPGAAGLSLDVTRIDAFRRALSTVLSDTQGVPERPSLRLDAILPLDEITLDLAARLNRLAPFGEGNPSVVLAATDLTLHHVARIGREELHRKLTVQDNEGRLLQVLWWDSSREPLPDGRFDLAFRVAINDRRELDVIFVDWRQREAPVVESRPPRVVIDWRGEPDPQHKIDEVMGESVCIWGEGLSRSQYPQVRRRAELVAADTLLIYTTPPDSASLRQAIQATDPRTIFVLAVDPPFVRQDDVLRQLSIAARNVIEQHGGVSTLDVLCGATAQSESVVIAGLDVLAAQGTVGSVSVAGNTVRLTPADQPADRAPNTAAAHQRLQHAIEEVAAYRRFFKKMPLDALV